MMAYQPYLIAKYSTGLDREVQPWLLPDDAQQDLFDGFVYRGVWNKRPGYNQFAIGLIGGAPYCESRIVHRITAEAYGTGSGITGPYLHSSASTPLRRGTITITAGGQTATDNGLGAFVTSPAGGSGTVNYTSGSMSITFANVVAGATPITVTYDFYPGNPVMMDATFYKDTNTRQMIVADTQYVNRYDPSTNRLVDISPATPYTGTKFSFFSWVNYPNASNNARLLFVNNADVIQQWDGTTVTNYAYTYTGVTTLTALHLFQVKDRLVILRPTVNGTTFGKRILISGTGANCDTFDTTATGAGLIDIPDASWIFTAEFNRDDLLIHTENSTWILRYTGNDITPFTLDKMDNSRGSGAPFSGITYLNISTTVSPRGFIRTDGYYIDRNDNKIPDYSFNEIDQENFALSFAGVVDQDRDHYLIHPSPQADTSDLILVNNYEENNFSVYRLPLSCMGTFLESFDITWNDLSRFSSWDEMAKEFGSWNSFSYTKGLPISIGGGQHGEIVRLNFQGQDGESGIEDNPVRIRGATVIDTNTLRVTTDFNSYVLGDYIYLLGMVGMEEGNRKQGAIKNIVTPNYVFDIDMPTIRFSSYISSGEASRVIPFESTTKKFNPFVNQAAKVRCGYLYFYVSTSNTGLTRNVNISNITQSNPAIVTAPNHQFLADEIITIFGAGGMTQINGAASPITVIDENTFSLNAIDSSAFTAYTSGGVAVGPVPCELEVDVIVNDVADTTQLEDSSGATIRNPYRVNCSPSRNDEGTKKWVKIYPNQTGRFIQFRVRNQQALSVIEIHAMMPGFDAVGRLI